MMESQPPQRGATSPTSPPPGSFENGIKTMYKGMLNVQENTLMTVLVLCSAIEMFAGVGFCNAFNTCGGYFAWAVSVGAISLVLASVLVFLMHKQYDIYEKIAPYAAGFLCVWWVLGAGITTFQGPFTAVGNGYFGAWGAFMASFLLAQIRLSGFSNWKNVKESFNNIGRKKPADAPGAPGASVPDVESAQPGLDAAGTQPYATPVSYPPAYPPQGEPPAYYQNPSGGPAPPPAYEAQDAGNLPPHHQTAM